jgi:8-amino-7-oxononanoate synthase
VTAPFRTVRRVAYVTRAMIDIEARLSELKALGLDRRTRLVSGPQGPHVLVDGKPVLLLCSENYLGLADHPRVREASADAARRWGVGAGASRVESGTMTVHRRLQERLAEFLGRERAVLFGSGYHAVTGTVASLARPGDVIFSDEANNAGLADGCRLSHADVFVYDHRDVEHLEWGIGHVEGRGALIVTDSVFATDGDVAPLADIVTLAQRFELRTLVDESHAVGALGPGGRGALADAGVEDQVDAVAGTLGKSLGGYGGFVACDERMAHYLASAAPSFIFSMAPAPPAAAAALAALEQLQQRPRRALKLAANADALRQALVVEGFEVTGSSSQIMALQIGDAVRTRRICEAALAQGVFAQGVRPPAVAPELSRVRLTVMSTHLEDELRAAARTLAAAARAVGFDPRSPLAPAEPALEAIADDDEYESPPPPELPPPVAGVFDFEAPEPVSRAA